MTAAAIFLATSFAVSLTVARWMRLCAETRV